MIKIKSVKGKIATGVIAATLLGSTGFAFANSTAGGQFKAWGDAQISAAKTAVSSAIAGQRTTAQNGIEADATAAQNTSVGNVNTAGNNEKADTKLKIENKLAEHVQSLNDQLAAYMASIGTDFDTLVSTENTVTTNSLNSQYTTLSANITAALKAAKDSNVKDVTEQSLLVKGKATSDLIKKINEVKASLAAEIASQKATANNEVSDHLTSEVARINSQLTTLISGLETTAINAITSAGQTVEDSAIANFERVINLTQTETPIKVDRQKLSVVETSRKDGILKFKVENTNEFDVVIKYQYRIVGGEGGVTETPFAESDVTPGVKSFEFDTAKIFGYDVPGTLFIQYLDENGNPQTLAEIASH